MILNLDTVLNPIPFVRDRPPHPKKKWSDVTLTRTLSFLFFDIVCRCSTWFLTFVQIEGRRLVLQEGLRGGSQDDGSFWTSVTSYFYAWRRHLCSLSYIISLPMVTSLLFRSDVTSLPLVTSLLFRSDVTSLPLVTSPLFRSDVTSPLFP